MQAMSSNQEDATTPETDGETFDEYSARMKTEFSAERVYAATRNLPAASTYTRQSHAGAPMTTQAETSAAGEPTGDAARLAIRHHGRRFVLFFALFLVFSAANVVAFLPGVPGIVHLVAFVGIVTSTPLYLYHEVRAVKAGGRLSDVISAFTRKNSVPAEDRR